MYFWWSNLEENRLLFEKIDRRRRSRLPKLPTNLNCTDGRQNRTEISLIFITEFKFFQ